MKKNMTKTNRMVKIAMLSAIAAVIMYLEFPLLPAFPFLKADLSDIPALIGAFSLGPVAGVIIEAFKVVLKLIIKGSSTFFVGDFANFVIGASFVLPASLIYLKRKTFNRALIAMAVGIVSMSFVGVLANYFVFAPLYGLPKEQLGAYIISGVLPFNLLKGVVISVGTMAIYKKVSPVITGERVLFKNKIA